ncbi:hypothetical protein MMC17_008993 [Xylographa soralifera]|nr:hypothetical protein [Xylographa soralifera]
MKFLSFLSVLSFLAVSLVANPIAVPDNHSLLENIGQHSLNTRTPIPNPVLPAGAKEGVHVWRRLDTTVKFYEKKGVNHDGLNALVKALGGQHADVVVGSGSSFAEIGLQLDRGWTNKNNGDGAGVSAYTEAYTPIDNEKFTYIGRLDGRSYNVDKVKAKGI